MTRCQPNRSTGALDYGRSTPKQPVSGSPTGIRPHPRRQINVDFSQLARVNISTLPSLGKETSLSVSDAASSWQRLCPTAWEIRTSGPLGPRLSYLLEHQSPDRPCERYIANEKKGVVDGHVDKRRGHANQS
jgi:hypothetical protein